MSMGRDLVEVVEDALVLDKYVERVADPRAGAVSTFSGVTRNHFQGKRVEKLEYEAYVPMAIKVMQDICEEARSKWDLIQCAIAHRTGTVHVGQPSVVIAVSSAHRKGAMDATAYIIDEIKARAPIWKKEFYQDGSVWKENQEGKLVREK